MPKSQWKNRKLPYHIIVSDCIMLLFFVYLILPFCAGESYINGCYSASVDISIFKWNFTLGIGQYLSPWELTQNGIIVVPSLLGSISYNGISLWNFSSFSFQAIDFDSSTIYSNYYIAASDSDAYGNIMNG